MDNKYKPRDFVYTIYNNEIVYARIYLVRCFISKNELQYDYLLEFGNSDIYIPECLVFSNIHSLFNYWQEHFLTFNYN